MLRLGDSVKIVSAGTKFNGVTGTIYAVSEKGMIYVMSDNNARSLIQVYENELVPIQTVFPVPKFKKGDEVRAKAKSSLCLRYNIASDQTGIIESVANPRVPSYWIKIGRITIIAMQDELEMAQEIGLMARI